MVYTKLSYLSRNHEESYEQQDSDHEEDIGVDIFEKLIFSDINRLDHSNKTKEAANNWKRLRWTHCK